MTLGHRLQILHARFLDTSVVAYFNKPISYGYKFRILVNYQKQYIIYIYKMCVCVCVYVCACMCVACV